mgnify:CR=1 FL=1
MSADVDAWFAAERPFGDVLAALRGVLRDFPVTEALKWRQPCYQAHGRNLAILGARKGGAVLSLLNGALLDDPDGQLLSAGPNTRAARLLSFASVVEVQEHDAALRRFLAQAIALEAAGQRVELGPTTEPIPDELTQACDQDPLLGAAFEALTPGRQRGYLLHFNAAKQSATRTARIEAARPRILAGMGLQDCLCGRSARMPRCDGSHKNP